jgi:hypothetical protein
VIPASSSAWATEGCFAAVRVGRVEASESPGAARPIEVGWVWACPCGAGCSRPASTIRLCALVELARRAPNRGNLSPPAGSASHHRRRRPPYLAGPARRGRGQLDRLGAICGEIVRWLACDAGVSRGDHHGVADPQRRVPTDLSNAPGLHVVPSPRADRRCGSHADPARQVARGGVAPRPVHAMRDSFNKAVGGGTR